MAGFFGKFFGRTISEAAGFGIGSALKAPLEPPLQEITNETWRGAVAAGVNVPLDPGDAADIVAEDVELQEWGTDQAAQLGFGGQQFDALVRAALNSPGLGELLTLLRREQISAEDFHHGLRKLKLESLWDKIVTQLTLEPLSPEIVAEAIQRGLMEAPFKLPVPPPTSGGTVPAFPTSPLSAADEALHGGIDPERLFVLTALIGNSMGPQEAAHAQFRGLIDETDYARAIAEGRTRNEWGGPIRDVAREIPSTTNYVEALVRNWIDRPAMVAGAAKHGMSETDAELLYLIHGRPLSWHQVFIGLRRGGVYDGPTTDIDPAFLKALQESDIRPEWYSLAWAQRYNYPTAFVLRTLTQSGDITAAESEQILLYEGWEPKLAHTVATRWGAGKQATAAPEIKSARTKLLTTLHKAYVQADAADAPVITALQAENYPQATIDGLLEVWGNERAFLQGQGANPPGPIT